MTVANLKPKKIKEVAPATRGEAISGAQGQNDDQPKLTARQMRFCHEYLRNGFNAIKAAGAAGYSTRDTGVGTRLLRMPYVAAHIRTLLANYWQSEHLTTSETLARLARIARMDPRKLFNADGSPKEISDLDEDIAYCLRGIETETELSEAGAMLTVTRKYKLADPLPALRTIAQIQKLLSPETTQLSVFLDLDARMDAAARRLKNRVHLTADLDGG